MASAQDRIQSLFDRWVEKGPERGLQLVAYHKGKKVVDVCSGVADTDKRSRVTPNTVFPVFSVTKGVAATLIHILVEKALLSYDRPIADYWPEFGCNGKERITLRQVLCHEAGLALMPTGLNYAKVCDWDAICAAMAGMTPSTRPGTKTNYHALTFGWLLGETAHRATGKSFNQLLDQEIRGPLGLKDLHVGIADEVEPRVATLYEQDQTPAPTVDTPRDVPYFMLPLGVTMNRPDLRRSCGPGATGIANARSLARLYAALLPGGVDGVELLPPRRVREMSRQETLFPIQAIPYPRRIGMGYFLAGLSVPEMSLRINAFGHGGYGGALGYADPSVGLAVGFTKNWIALDSGTRIEAMQALRKALRIRES